MQDATREIALRLLIGVLRRGRPLEETLDALPPAEPRDRAAGHRLAATVLRRLGTLDAVLEPWVKRAPPEEIRLILRLGAAQLLLLDTPAHAAVATAVALARSSGFVPFAGMVNAVLRRVAEAGPAALQGLDSARLDTPPWLWASWGRQARAIAQGQAQPAPLDLSLRPGATPPPGGMALPTGSWRYPAGTHVTELEGFADGDFWVQDAAAALPALLLAPRPGEHIADLCAAPGGKTAQLAAAGAHVTAVERDAGRLARLAENLARLRLSAELVQADATAWAPEQKFDAVLLDAPCSATGTIRRHPDVAWLKRPRDVAALAAQQDALMAAAARLLRPGGRLVFAVCSLQPEEQQPATAGMLLRPEPFAADALPAGLVTDGVLRTHPGLWPELGGMDGFFAALYVKL